MERSSSVMPVQNRVVKESGTGRNIYDPFIDVYENWRTNLTIF
jgi:hypothetical protein